MWAYYKTKFIVIYSNNLFPGGVNVHFPYHLSNGIQTLALADRNTSTCFTFKANATWPSAVLEITNLGSSTLGDVIVFVRGKNLNCRHTACTPELVLTADMQLDPLNPGPCSPFCGTPVNCEITVAGSPGLCVFICRCTKYQCPKIMMMLHPAGHNHLDICEIYAKYPWNQWG